MGEGVSEYQITEDVSVSNGERCISLTCLAPTFDEVVRLYRAAKMARADADTDIAIGMVTVPQP